MTERLDAQLTNPRAERVRRAAGLSRRSARRRHGQFLVEGPQGVREAVVHAARQVRDVYLTAAAAERYPEIVAAARAARLHLHTATADVLAAMSEDAQGVLAVLEAAGATTSATLADLAAADGAGPRLVAVLTGVADPGNAGTVIRAADAAGADAVVLTAGSVEALNPKVVRSTAGSLFHLPVVTGASLDATLAELRERGAAAGAPPTVLAADAAGEWDLDELQDRAHSAAIGALTTWDDALPATDLLAPDLAAPSVWVFGNEAHGLAPAERDACDAVVRVPIHGQAESLNLATAATLCLYASARAQRRGDGRG
ncbi:TrmH family RNA methyltransferase [Georgenia thermotolerans]|uniref:RNA methyltransferase n=1 Tax=Georgenia thermotolerans TaxID=527326 RepID=A0A7J5UNN0_9MICO|nr:RNA methyltransferase [Georgenia thermotolerans]KAE8763957.1 RNA methyltransferase [Georgenia thermotolerans]